MSRSQILTTQEVSENAALAFQPIEDDAQWNSLQQARSRLNSKLFTSICMTAESTKYIFVAVGQGEGIKNSVCP